MDNRQKEKSGDWLMDIAKYMLTALVLSSVLIDMNNPLVLVVVIILAIAIFFLGMHYVKEIKKG